MQKCAYALLSKHNTHIWLSPSQPTEASDVSVPYCPGRRIRSYRGAICEKHISQYPRHGVMHVAAMILSSRAAKMMRRSPSFSYTRLKKLRGHGNNKAIFHSNASSEYGAGESNARNQLSRSGSSPLRPIHTYVRKKGSERDATLTDIRRCGSAKSVSGGMLGICPDIIQVTSCNLFGLKWLWVY